MVRCHGMFKVITCSALNAGTVQMPESFYDFSAVAVEWSHGIASAVVVFLLERVSVRIEGEIFLVFDIRPWHLGDSHEYPVVDGLKFEMLYEVVFEKLLDVKLHQFPLFQCVDVAWQHTGTVEKYKLIALACHIGQRVRHGQDAVVHQERHVGNVVETVVFGKYLVYVFADVYVFPPFCTVWLHQCSEVKLIPVFPEQHDAVGQLVFKKQVLFDKRHSSRGFRDGDVIARQRIFPVAVHLSRRPFVFRFFLLSHFLSETHLWHGFLAVHEIGYKLGWYIRQCAAKRCLSLFYVYFEQIGAQHVADEVKAENVEVFLLCIVYVVVVDEFFSFVVGFRRHTVGICRYQ